MAIPDCPDGYLAVLSLDFGGGLSPLLALVEVTPNQNRGERSCSTKDSIKASNGGQKWKPALRDETYDLELIYNELDTVLIAMIATYYTAPSTFTARLEPIAGETGARRMSGEAFVRTLTLPTPNDETMKMSASLRISEEAQTTIP